MLNHTNPMSILTAPCCDDEREDRAQPQRPGVRARPAGELGMDYDEKVQWKIAGINHQAWLLEVPGREDLYPEISAAPAVQQRQLTSAPLRSSLSA